MRSYSTPGLHDRADGELVLAAPAKVNLGLEVLRRRADGFHDINTLFAAVELHDDLHLRSRADGAILCTVEGNPDLPSDRSNLCVRAAEELRLKLGDPALGLDIMLRKRIPIGAGLGGGSSDAAGVLMGAASLWGADPDDAGLPEIAAALGSDVPFFLMGGTARAGSRGEILEPLRVDLPYGVLLVNPGIHIPTPWAYRAVGRSGERSASDLPALLRAGLADPSLLRQGVVNDFEPAIFAAYPVLLELKERLYGRGALFALMSGSGSTMFGLFATEVEAADAATGFPGCWSAVTRFLP